MTPLGLDPINLSRKLRVWECFEFEPFYSTDRAADVVLYNYRLEQVAEGLHWLHREPLVNMFKEYNLLATRWWRNVISLCRDKYFTMLPFLSLQFALGSMET